MNRLFASLIIAALALSAFADYGFARDSGLRCGTRIITPGMRQDEVLALCGEPNWTNSWQEAYESGSLLSKRDYLRSALIVNCEEWTYNWGPSRFITYLLFRNGILDRIYSGGYGY